VEGDSELMFSRLQKLVVLDFLDNATVEYCPFEQGESIDSFSGDPGGDGLFFLPDVILLAFLSVFLENSGDGKPMLKIGRTI
jgi:hypothetical protein